MRAAAARRLEGDDDEDDDDDGHDHAADDEVGVDLIFLLGEGRVGVEARGTRAALLEVGQADAARHDHRGTFRLFFRCGHSGRRRGGNWSRCGRGLAVINLQLDLAEAQGLAGLERDFRNFFIVYERAVRGIQIADNDIGTAQKNFRVMAGDGSIGDLKGVILHAANRRAFDLQLERAASHALIQDNKFRHRLIVWNYECDSLQVKRKSVA